VLYSIKLKLISGGIDIVCIFTQILTGKFYDKSYFVHGYSCLLHMNWTVELADFPPKLEYATHKWPQLISVVCSLNKTLNSLYKVGVKPVHPRMNVWEVGRMKSNFGWTMEQPWSISDGFWFAGLSTLFLLTHYFTNVKFNMNSI